MKKLTIFYDDWCPNCTKFVGIIQQLDWLKLIEVKKLRNKLDTNSYDSLNLVLAKQQMASLTNKWNYGYVSLYQIFIRIPLFGILIPFFFMLRITGLGQYLYIQLAVNRQIVPLHCNAEICEM